jgi:uncharacterized protein YggU (UPF0235/DUF167 family)
MLIKVKVFPGSKTEELREKSENGFEVRVKEKAENNLANKKVLEILSRYFGIPQSGIRLIKGGKKRNKIYEIP